MALLTRPQRPEPTGFFLNAPASAGIPWADVNRRNIQKLPAQPSASCCPKSDPSPVWFRLRRLRLCRSQRRGTRFLKSRLKGAPGGVAREARRGGTGRKTLSCTHELSRLTRIAVNAREPALRTGASCGRPGALICCMPPPLGLALILDRCVHGACAGLGGGKPRPVRLSILPPARSSCEAPVRRPPRP